MNSGTSVVLLTPAGRSAVASLLVAGPAAVEAVSHWFEPAGRPLAERPLNRIAFGRWRAVASGEEVVVCRRAADQVEVHCHGGRSAARAIIASLTEFGCNEIAWSDWIRQAEDDPLRAEARIALAAASTERTALILWDQHEGALRQAIDEIAGQIALGRATEAIAQIDALLEWSGVGRHLTVPWKVVLAGPPNAGKSSVINALVGYERAIVHAAPGTTRDVVTAQTAVDGWPIELADTAGLRSGNEPLEVAGIELTRRRAESADVVLAVFDRRQPWGAAEAAIAGAWPEAIVVLNKSDLPADPSVSSRPGVLISALCGHGIEGLITAIADRLVPKPPPPGAAVPFSPWHVETLAELRTAIAADDANAAQQSLARLTARNG